MANESLNRMERQALGAARELALDYFPIQDNEKQMTAYSEMLQTINSGDLVGAIEALRRARFYSTPIWRKWHDEWLRACRRQILGWRDPGME